MSRPVPPLTPELLATFDRNVIHVDLPDGLVRLVPSVEPQRPPFSGSMYVVSVWNPYGRPSSAGENERWAAASEASDRSRKTQRPATIHPADLSWVEQAVALRRTQLRNAQNLAERYGQPAFFRWDATGLAVLATTDLTVRHHWPVRVEPLPRRPCVMEPDRGEVECERWGGPWTSASISAAYEWELEYGARLQAFGGCDVCQGRKRGPGGPIGLVACAIPSRWTSERITLGPIA